MSTCTTCDRSAGAYSTQCDPCDWAARVAECRASGCREYAPNGLRITCIRHDGTLLEHEHADHPDYKFPVQIELVPPLTDESEYPEYPETHALIYADRSMAVTMYECCYAMWHLDDGEWMGGSLWNKRVRLSEASREEIKRRYPRKDER